MKKTAMQAVGGLAVACVLASCGPVGNRQPTPGGAAAPKPRMDAAARFGLLDATTICPETCTHLIGSGGFGDDGFTFYFEVVDSNLGDRGIFAIAAPGGSPQFVDNSPSATIVDPVPPRVFRITAEVVDGAGQTAAIEFTFGGGGAPSLIIGGEPRQLTTTQTTATDGRCDIGG